jgi:hypothetical protein
VQRAVLAAVRRALDEQLVALLDHVDVARLALGEVAAGARDADHLAFDRDVDAGRDRDGLLADARHG